ncbi:MAG: hypothetical protein E7220_00330 [Clostridiales bacterium]|nr:hypothetical protein [Clostridiales bacterium]
MTGSFGAAGAVSVLLDVIPIIACLLLAISFVIGRSRRKAEEKELKAAIKAFNEASEEDRVEDIQED